MAQPRSKSANVSVEHGALSDHQRLIRQRGVTPLMYQYGETVITKTKEVAPAERVSDPDT
jgi:hypothetical protein